MPDADAEDEPAGMALLHAVERLRHLIGGFRPDVHDRRADRHRRRFCEERFGDGQVARRIARDPDRAVPEIFKVLDAGGQRPLLVVLDEQIGAVTPERWSSHPTLDVAPLRLIPPMTRSRRIHA